MNNIHENVFNNLMSNYPEGPFNAVCLSGVTSDNNAGTGTDSLDGFIDQDDKHLYLIVRPLINIGNILPDPLNYRGDDLYKIIRMHYSVFLARSKTEYNSSQPAISFGQILTCNFSEGSLQNSDFSGLEFSFPVATKVDYDYLALKNDIGLPTTTDGTAKAAFGNNSAARLGTSNRDFGAVDLIDNNNKMVQPYQIPNSHLAIAANLPHRITSIMGARPDPFKPKAVQASHGGVDIAQATGSPLFAVFDGTVVSIGRSGEPYIKDESGIYTKVGSKGYGLKIVTRHKEKRNNGEEFEFTLEYGHIYTYTPGLKIGSKVKKGQVIATVGNRGGSTGPHLHLQMREGRKAHSGKKMSALAMFGWHDRLSWKSKSLKDKWSASWPDLTNPELSAYGESDPNVDPYATSDNPLDPYATSDSSDTNETG